MNSVILFETRDNIALIRINRPSVFNALNGGMSGRLGDRVDPGFSCATRFRRYWDAP